MGICNLCKLNKIKSHVKKKNERVILRSSSFMGGTDVFVLAKTELMPKTYKEPSDELPNGDSFYASHHVAWFMEIPERCAC
jgi:hypothetical protein